MSKVMCVRLSNSGEKCNHEYKVVSLLNSLEGRGFWVEARAQFHKAVYQRILLSKLIC